MKVLMLGWEYPPHINGGLGTACEGLTTGLARHGVAIDFVIPRLVGDEQAGHMRLIDSLRGGPPASGHQPLRAAENFSINKISIPAMLSPYLGSGDFSQLLDWLKQLGGGDWQSLDFRNLPPHLKRLIDDRMREPVDQLYGWDVFEEVGRYTANVVAVARDLEFDLIHAHDWMTFPAAVALARLSGKPLVVHIHSLEYDRSGAAVNQRICEIERFGIQNADRVIAVSHYTGSLVAHHYTVPSAKIAVVHNGVYSRSLIQGYRRAQQWRSKVVLFLGRITFQKGPDYFVEAAARVLPHIPDVTFVMAGAGDMLPVMMERVNQLGLGRHFHFPGFLRGEEVEEMFSVADLYVMPSVSEPFGISALEAISSDTPVIISRQSGVSEVLSHALKVDFWDVERLADLMINTLLHEELRSDIVAMARTEVRRLHWEAAALKTLGIYRSLT